MIFYLFEAFLIYLLLSIPIAIIMIYLWKREIEKEIWNKGNCPHCEEKWEYYTVDSHGSRCYKCKNEHSCEITYNVDKRRY